MSIGFSILAFFVILSPLIFVHELGHFLAARWNKITVEEFGIGYPPRLKTLFERNGTKYTLNWLPLGGFTRLKGEDDPTVEGGFAAAPKLARLSVLFAGPGANLLAAFVLLVAMFMLGAPEELPGAHVVMVEPGTPAAEAGLQAGDIIRQADEVIIERRSDLTEYIYNSLGRQITLIVERDMSTVEIVLTPRTEWPEGQGPTGIQIEPIITVQRYGFFAAVWRTLEELALLLKAFVEIPVDIIQQQLPARYLRPISVVGISQIGGQAIDTSIDQNVAWPTIQWTAFISLALAITNLLPLPAFDGGRISFVLLEAIRGKRVDPQREMLVHFIGFSLLLAAMVIFVYLDIVDPLVIP